MTHHQTENRGRQVCLCTNGKAWPTVLPVGINFKSLLDRHHQISWNLASRSSHDTCYVPLYFLSIGGWLKQESGGNLKPLYTNLLNHSIMLMDSSRKVNPFMGPRISNACLKQRKQKQNKKVCGCDWGRGGGGKPYNAFGICKL